MNIPKHVETLLEDLAESLQISPSRYEEAESSYKSVADWLHRTASQVRDADPQIYPQGSFRLGTAIRPVSEAEDYDLDLVCELTVSKSVVTQAQLKLLLGRELKAYAEAHGMDAPQECRRCWTQDYADSARFHLDTLPAIPDAIRQRLLLEQRGFSTQWATTAIAITDREHPRFTQITKEWPHSNPKGYAEWFKTRMGKVFEARRQLLALEARAGVEDIPEYRVRTPLQYAIQVLKRHRDLMFQDRVEDKPISIILTTLAAHAYQQETTIAVALYSILSRMDGFIENRGGVDWVGNPTDPAENFADRWQKFPTRKQAFYEWLEKARREFSAAAGAVNRDTASTLLEGRFGKKLLSEANARRNGQQSRAVNKLLSGSPSTRIVLNPAHRQTPPWSLLTQGSVRIERAIVEQNGFRPHDFSSDESPLPKHASLRFEADTNVPQPYKVYWQIVNTGREAEAAYSLRGGFDEGLVTPGLLTHRESTLYAGKHSIECFVVKGGLLAARSGQFIVNIQ